MAGTGAVVSVQLSMKCWSAFIWRHPVAGHPIRQLTDFWFLIQVMGCLVRQRLLVSAPVDLGLYPELVFSALTFPS